MEGDDAQFRHNLGLVFAMQGRTDEAIREYEASLRLDPDHYLALVHLAEALGSRGRFPEAEAHLRHALELAPGDYQLDAAVHRTDGLAYDYWCDAARIRVTSAVEWPGIWAPRHRWEGDGPQWE